MIVHAETPISLGVVAVCDACAQAHGYTPEDFNPNADMEPCEACECLTRGRGLPPGETGRPTITVTLTLAEADLILEAIDSHRYWQAPHEWRHSGDVRVPEEIDPTDEEWIDAKARVAECDELERQLREIVTPDTK